MVRFFLALVVAALICGRLPAQCYSTTCLRPTPPYVLYQPPAAPPPVFVRDQQYPTVVRFVPAPTPLNPWPQPATYYQPAQDARAVLVPVWPQYPGR